MPQQPAAKARTTAGASHRDLKTKLAKAKGAQRIQIEINHYKNSDELLIPKLKFQRVVRELVEGICSEKNADPDLAPETGEKKNVEQEVKRFNSQALQVLQEAAEDYLVRGFQDAVQCASHAKRVTIMPVDQSLSQLLRGQ